MLCRRRDHARHRWLLGYGQGAGNRPACISGYSSWWFSYSSNCVWSKRSCFSKAQSGGSLGLAVRADARSDHRRMPECDFWYLGVKSTPGDNGPRRLFSREKRDRVRVLLEAGAGAGVPGPGWIRYQRMSASGGRVLAGGSLSCGRAPPRGGRPRADASLPGVRRLVVRPSRHLGPCSRQRAPRRRCSL